jgi:hypothetical protein
VVVPHRDKQSVVVIICRRGALSMCVVASVYIGRMSRAPTGWSVGCHAVFSMSFASNYANLDACVISMCPLNGSRATTRGSCFLLSSCSVMVEWSFPPCILSNTVQNTRFAYFLVYCIGVLSRGAFDWGGIIVPYQASVRYSLAGCHMMGIRCVLL